MGEYVWTVVKIGGAASQATLDELQKLLDEEFDGSDSDIDVIAKCIADRACVEASGLQNYGNVDAILAFCRDKNLTIWTSCEGASGCFDPAIQYWKPGMAEIADASATNDHDPSLTIDQLREKFAEGATLEQVIEELAPAEGSAVPPIAMIAVPAPPAP